MKDRPKPRPKRRVWDTYRAEDGAIHRVNRRGVWKKVKPAPPPTKPKG